MGNLRGHTLLESGDDGFPSFGCEPVASANRGEVRRFDLLPVNKGNHHGVRDDGTEFFHEVKRERRLIARAAVQEPGVRVEPAGEDSANAF